MIARRFLIRGIVQGVGFRYFAVRSAGTHQVFGYARNLPDGRVEVFAQGGEQAMKHFAEDLAAGPNGSRVDHVEETVLDTDRAYSTFRIES
ncbi:MAG: acylphosphatase [Acidobacteria bacterium]|nr:acylphosphatase [Acidobacteriota bacterium]